MPNKINTVTGTCTPQELGTTLVHEHLLIAWSGWEADSIVVKGFKRDEAMKLCVDRLQRVEVAWRRDVYGPMSVGFGT